MSRKPAPLIDRLMAKVVMRPDGCWQFTGSLSAAGYGRLWSGPGGKADEAHRLAYQELRGAIPAGLELDHLCRNRACVNPDHLEPVTPRVNQLRGLAPTARNALKTECNNGHAFDESNTHYLPSGSRRCRQCSAATSRRYEARRKATQ